MLLPEFIRLSIVDQATNLHDPQHSRSHMDDEIHARQIIHRKLGLSISPFVVACIKTPYTKDLPRLPKKPNVITSRVF